MNYRRIIINKLKHKDIETTANLLDKYYYWWVEDTQYKYTKIDAFMDFIENEDFFESFCKKIKSYIEIDGIKT